MKEACGGGLFLKRSPPQAFQKLQIYWPFGHHRGRWLRLGEIWKPCPRQALSSFVVALCHGCI